MMERNLNLLSDSGFRPGLRTGQDRSDRSPAPADVYDVAPAPSTAAV